MLLAALDEHGECRARVEGTSMWPFIRPTDQIVIRRPGPKPQLGDVTAFFVGDQLVAHRIVGRRRDNRGAWHVWVHGDSMPGSCVRMNWGELAGVVTAIVRDGKTRALWFCFPCRLFAIPIGFVLCALVSARRFCSGAVV